MIFIQQQIKWVSFLKRSNKRKYGFTLLELIISMAIISIISASVYTGYIIMIKQTKSGQVKQEAALEGKKVIEALQGNNFSIPTITLTIDAMSFSKNGTSFVRYLNDKYEDKEENGDPVTEDTAKYIEKITLTPTKVQDSIDGIKLGNNNLQGNQIYINREDTDDYIKYSDEDNHKDIHNVIPLYSENSKNKMELSIYLTPQPNNSQEDVGVFDYKGNSLCDFTKVIDDNLIINFDNYKETNGTLPSDTQIQIYMYNLATTAASVYLEKPDALDVGLQLCKGEIKIYNSNLSDENAGFGTLYDITVQVSVKNGENLFTGYYKKNLHQ